MKWKDLLAKAGLKGDTEVLALDPTMRYVVLCDHRFVTMALIDALEEGLHHIGVDHVICVTVENPHRDFRFIELTPEPPNE
jgi:hypothetical protein